MSASKRTELDKWVILLDPDYGTALEEAFDREEATEKDFPERTAEAEHNEDNLVQGAKSQAQAVQANTVVYASPYGKIQYFKKDESDFKYFLEHYNRTMYVWQSLTKGYTDMLQTQKKLPDEATIRKRIDAAADALDGEISQAKEAEVGLANARGILQQTWNEFNAAKDAIGIVVAEFRNARAAIKANDLQEQAEKLHEILEMVTKAVGAASEAAHNPVGAAAEAAEAIMAADDLMDDESPLNQARKLRDEILHSVAKLGEKKVTNAVERLQKAYTGYMQNRGVISEARKVYEHDKDKVAHDFDAGAGKRLLSGIDELLEKAGVVQSFVGDFENVVDLVPNDLKGTWLTGHPQREENQKTADRHVAIIYNHRKDAAGFKKAAGEAIATWKAIAKKTQDTLLDK